MFRNLGAELKRKGMTQTDLAKALDLAPSTMSQKLNGRSIITLSEAKKIKKILGVDIPIEELFSQEESSFYGLNGKNGSGKPPRKV